MPLSQWSNQRSWISCRSMSAAGPKSISPVPVEVGFV